MTETHHRRPLPKSATGIAGLDEITLGGLPTGRPTLVSGEAGSGKSLFAMSFLVHGARACDEPGVFISFEESEADILANVQSLGFDLPALIEQRKLIVEHVDIGSGKAVVAGEYDFEALFIRLEHAINSIGAKRIVFDTLEALTGGFHERALLRAELIRMFRWLKGLGVTAVVTGERLEGASSLGLEAFVTDCVITLANRVWDGVSTRFLRIAKYRGSAHGTNEYPFLLDESGFSVLPLTSIGLRHDAADEVVSTGVDGIDQMLERGGVYRGSSLLITGSAGSAKTTFAMTLIAAACDRGERCLYFSYEESPSQLVRNMRTLGIDLARHLDAGTLVLESQRPTLLGLEAHLAKMHRMVAAHRPTFLVVDPMSALTSAGNGNHARAVMLRLVDLLKRDGITSLYLNLVQEDAGVDTELEVSSLMDTWISLRLREFNGERNRELYVLKSRGMGHSNQVREFVLTKHGFRLMRPYVGPEGVLTGSSRVVQEMKERAEATLRRKNVERSRRQLEQRDKALEADLSKLRAAYQQEREELLMAIAEAEAREKDLAADQEFIARHRTRVTVDQGDEDSP